MTTRFLPFLLLAALKTSPAAAGTALALQGWHWGDVTAKLGQMHDAGFTAIMLSPHTASCSGAFGGQGYDPSDFRSFDGGFGNEAELATLLRTAHGLGMQVYANMVMNHMCTHQDYRYDRFSWNDFHHVGQIRDWNDAWQVENGDLDGLNDLAQESDYVRGELAEYLRKTNAMGFDGFRFDGAKHVPRWYWQDDVAPKVNAWGKFGFAEVYDASLDLLQSYADTGLAVTDYSLYFAVVDAFRAGGDLASLDGAGFAARDGGDAVTFAENHDVGPPANRLLAYAFLAGYPGYPLFANIDLNDRALSNLVWVHEHLASGGYANRWKEHDVLVFEREGHLLVGINQSSQWQTRWVDTSWSSTRLHDYSGHVADSTTEADRRVAVSIPPMSYVMLAP